MIPLRAIYTRTVSLLPYTTLFRASLVEFDAFFGELAGLSYRFLGLSVEVCGQGFGAGLRFVGELLDGVVHGLISFGGESGRLRRSFRGLGGNGFRSRRLGGDLLGCRLCGDRKTVV